LKVKEFI
jgi:hypothetical protein